MYPNSIKKLIEAFKYFPGIGEKTAERFAFSVLSLEKEQVYELSDNIRNVKDNIKRCSVCNNLCEGDVCSICKDLNRDSSYLCVVEDPKTVFSIEKIFRFNKIIYTRSPARACGSTSTMWRASPAKPSRPVRPTSAA